MGCAAEDGRTARVRDWVTPPVSAIVPQDWQPPQRPTHLGVVQPHSEHRNIVFAMMLHSRAGHGHHAALRPRQSYRAGQDALPREVVNAG
ncbi:hypothetical protein GCM10027079_13140 [Sediminivirga luteola]|uniref:Uncharacterized protein n=1 Tax=Sediminivirga luteola TaxID=1774748 RepID=A0A8J2XIC3_9MICO|nr:hypothetical protein GCM10011333_00590 [Sediminivirga luteola]